MCRLSNTPLSLRFVLSGRPQSSICVAFVQNPIVKFWIYYLLWSITNRRPWPRRCSEIGLRCCLLAELVSREELVRRGSTAVSYRDSWSLAGAVRWDSTAVACEASSLSVFLGLHPGLGEQGTQIPLEHPVVGRHVLQTLLSVGPEWELEVEPVWELGQTVEARTWVFSVLEHSLAVSPAGPVVSSVWRSTYPIPEVEAGWALELGSCCGHWLPKPGFHWQLAGLTLSEPTVGWPVAGHLGWRGCWLLGSLLRWSWSWPLVLRQGLIQPPLVLEPDSELEVDQPLLTPLASLSEPTESEVHTFPFLQLRSWLLALSENRVPQLDVVPSELSEEFPPRDVFSHQLLACSGLW